MSEKGDGWDWFEDDVAMMQGGANAAFDVAEVAALAARCFRGPDGDQLLAYLRALTTERALGPASSDQVLRHLEGQRHLIAHIGNLIVRGRRGPASFNER